MLEVVEQTLRNKKVADRKSNRFSKYSVDFSKLSVADLFYLYETIDKSVSPQKFKPIF